MQDGSDTYKRRYKMRAVGADGLNIVVSIPRVVIEREAEKRNLSVDDFLQKFRAVAMYNNFDGVLYQFEEAKESGEAIEIESES